MHRPLGHLARAATDATTSGNEHTGLPKEDERPTTQPPDGQGDHRCQLPSHESTTRRLIACGIEKTILPKEVPTPWLVDQVRHGATMAINRATHEHSGADDPGRWRTAAQCRRYGHEEARNEYRGETTEEQRDARPVPRRTIIRLELGRRRLSPERVPHHFAEPYPEDQIQTPRRRVVSPNLPCREDERCQGEQPNNVRDEVIPSWLGARRSLERKPRPPRPAASRAKEHDQDNHRQDEHRAVKCSA